MNDKIIVTIGRQFGSGGLEVGKKLAKKLNIDFYDKELISIAAKESGFTESIFEKADEAPSNSFLYSIVMGSYPMNSLFFQNNDLLTNDKLFNIQSSVIRKISKNKSCVIVGRCSDYILRDEKNIVRVFLRADMEMRKERVKNEYNIKESNTENIIEKKDKKRASYYNYYTGSEWSSLENYDIVLNTSKIGIDNTIEVIADYVEKIKRK